MLMIGTPGTGKTHLSASIIRNVLHNSTKSVTLLYQCGITKKSMDAWLDARALKRKSSTISPALIYE